MISYRYTIYNLIFHYWVPYLKDPVHDTNDFMLSFYLKFGFRCYFITPTPCEKIFISRLFFMSMIRLSKICTLSTIHYKLLLTKYCLAPHLSFKLVLRWWFTVIRINDSLICHLFVYKIYKKWRLSSTLWVLTVHFIKIKYSCRSCNIDDTLILNSSLSL